MLHYVYKTTVIDTGEYYIGKHSTDKANDNYIGSGKGLLERVSEDYPITIEILKYADSSDEAYELEEQIIGDLWKTDPLCLNRCKGGKIGYADNRLGKPQSKEWRNNIGRANSKSKSGIALEASRQNAKLGSEARRGMKDTIEVKKKRAESVSKATAGKPKPHLRKKIYIDNKEYLGVTQVTEEYNITRQTVYNRIKSDKWNWYYV